jgi:putative Ca2+/H+ antiporter (TMEM165/GDT1 family)
VLPLIASTFGVIFVAELPDKTALAALCLATQYRTRSVIAGAWLAFLVQTAVAVVAGSLLQLLPVQPVRIAAGLGFIVFAILALRRKDEGALDAERHRRFPAWVACFLVVFAAEWGDLTQLATAALIAHTGQTIPVAIGAVAALWTVTVLAAFAGERLGELLSPTTLNRISAVLFAAIGGFIVVTALFPTLVPSF